MKHGTYRTYSNYKFDKDLFCEIGNYINKPINGLWGCANGEWYRWNRDADFKTYKYYFDWKLPPSAKIYRIDVIDDFKKLIYDYGYDRHGVKVIDWVRLWKDGYDGVELTQNGLTECAYTDFNLFGLSVWDVPSICLFNIDCIDVSESRRCSNKNYCNF